MNYKLFSFVVLSVVLALSLSACGGGLSVMPGGSGTFTSVSPTHADLVFASVSETQKLDVYIPEWFGPFLFSPRSLYTDFPYF